MKYNSSIPLSTCQKCLQSIFNPDTVHEFCGEREITDVLLFKRGARFSLVEFNKALSLVGLTLMLFAFLPQFASQNKELLWISMNSLWIHSAYSMYQFYGYSPKKLMSEPKIKQASVVFGQLSHASLIAGFFGFISPAALLWSSTIAGISHFWTMEVDYKYRLQVRPYAYLPFVLAAAVVGYQFVYL
ncbi:hypothetical protein CEUSTIGMA_g12380.t1 [Chlamydomonas eustigma]|uniref:Uncharacterized protein n=1 Tax=Chlamydomonas eustigma TaxID=1157962 RepID=A0A250XPT7_9CHLO|nr:hypothetical protein CEUSTIGMA_g12380.t1 [Chlamydomonas eustigma]|eukprot:GAX84959.1 hypothetical protein CEUSTIGMA_g12380.t1 [Chlamydomonas eustigma]